MSKIKDYIHAEIGREIRSIAGYYTINEERIFTLGDRDFLCVVGQGLLDTSCCGQVGIYYANIPGYILAWQIRSDDSGQPITEVEPIVDDDQKREISSLVRKELSVQQVNFL